MAGNGRATRGRGAKTVDVPVGRPNASRSKPTGGVGPSQTGGVRTKNLKRPALQEAVGPRAGKRVAVEGDVTATAQRTPPPSAGLLLSLAADGSPPSVRSNANGEDVSPAASGAWSKGGDVRQRELGGGSREGDRSSSHASNRSSQATFSATRTPAPRQYGMPSDDDQLHQNRRPIPFPQQVPQHSAQAQLNRPTR